MPDTAAGYMLAIRGIPRITGALRGQRILLGVWRLMGMEGLPMGRAGGKIVGPIEL